VAQPDLQLEVGQGVEPVDLGGLVPDLWVVMWVRLNFQGILNASSTPRWA
jgi:hypothetical protein